MSDNGQGAPDRSAAIHTYDWFSTVRTRHVVSAKRPGPRWDEPMVPAVKAPRACAGAWRYRMFPTYEPTRVRHRQRARRERWWRSPGPIASRGASSPAGASVAGEPLTAYHRFVALDRSGISGLLHVREKQPMLFGLGKKPCFAEAIPTQGCPTPYARSRLRAHERDRRSLAAELRSAQCRAACGPTAKSRRQPNTSHRGVDAIH